jgi:hypothetical protein
LPHLAAAPPAEDLICAALRGENPAWPWPDGAQEEADFHRLCDLHGVNALLHDRARSCKWPSGVQAPLRDKSVQLAIWELRHQQVLTQAVEALKRIGVQPILVKGTALAYSLYADPSLRTRADTDVLIPLGAKEQVESALTEIGFQRSLGVSGELVSYQASFTRQADGAAHTLDLHWKINNSELLSTLFTYEELKSRAQSLPRLHEHTLAPSSADALLIACMHLATHKENPYYVDGAAHFGGDRLIWLADLDLLSQTLSDNEWRTVIALARAKGLRAVTLEGLAQARGRLATRYPEWVASALAERGEREPPAEYLAAGKLRQQSMDFLAVEGWPRRWQLAREILFPSPSYMRSKYPESAAAWMPWLYFRRAAQGLAKRVVTRGGGR